MSDQIQVNFHNPLSSNSGTQSISEGTTISDFLMSMLGQGADLEDYTIRVNDQQVTASTPLASGDNVQVGGGSASGGNFQQFLRPADDVRVLPKNFAGACN